MPLSPILREALQQRIAEIEAELERNKRDPPLGPKQLGVNLQLELDKLIRALAADDESRPPPATILE
jgi:hypothetical protein